jgi:hypothetical protein
MKPHDIININLRTDLENCNLGDGFTFRPRGFFQDLSTEYPEPNNKYRNRWVIEVLNDEGVLHSIYDYTSESEYDNDVKVVELYNKQTVNGVLKNYAIVDFNNGKNHLYLLLMIMYEGKLFEFQVSQDDWDDYWNSINAKSGVKDFDLHYEDGMEGISVAVYELDSNGNKRTDKFEPLKVFEIGDRDEFESRGTPIHVSTTKTYIIKYGGEEYEVVKSDDPHSDTIIRSASGGEISDEVRNVVNNISYD